MIVDLIFHCYFYFRVPAESGWARWLLYAESTGEDRNEEDGGSHGHGTYTTEQGCTNDCAEDGSSAVVRMAGSFILGDRIAEQSGGGGTRWRSIGHGSRSIGHGGRIVREERGSQPGFFLFLGD